MILVCFIHRYRLGSLYKVGVLLKQKQNRFREGGWGRSNLPTSIYPAGPGAALPNPGEALAPMPPLFICKRATGCHSRNCLLMFKYSWRRCGLIWKIIGGMLVTVGKQTS